MKSRHPLREHGGWTIAIVSLVGISVLMVAGWCCLNPSKTHKSRRWKGAHFIVKHRNR